MNSHAAVAAELLGEEKVRAVIADYRTAPISEAERALFAFIDKVNGECAKVEAGDVAALREKGYSDEAVYDAVMACALFNFYNRWIDATGVHAMSTEAHRQSGKRLAQRGYVMTAESRGHASA